MNDGKKRADRRQTRLMQSESAWLQKALFALRKVEETRDRIADLNDSPLEPYALEVGGSRMVLEDLEDALEARAKALLGDIRERRNRM